MKKMDITFEKAMERLQQITTILEKGEIELDESLKLFEEGTKLTAFCYEKLENAKQKVNEIAVISE